MRLLTFISQNQEFLIHLKTLVFPAISVKGRSKIVRKKAFVPSWPAKYSVEYLAGHGPLF